MTTICLKKHQKACSRWTSTAGLFLFLFFARNKFPNKMHWRIQGGRQGCMPPWGPNSFIFMQFLAKIWKIIAILGVGAPPWGKSWIRHWNALEIYLKFHRFPQKCIAWSILKNYWNFQASNWMSKISSNFWVRSVIVNFFSLTPAGESIPSKTTTASTLVRALGINTSRVHIAKCSLLHTLVIV